MPGLDEVSQSEEVVPKGLRPKHDKRGHRMFVLHPPLRAEPMPPTEEGSAEPRAEPSTRGA